MRTLGFNFNKVPVFARKPVNINGLRSESPKLALVSAIRYNCDVR